ncbi:MAG: hypothetical protein OQL19_09055 [Gammaproteobacteria bacterium]|nr:hypothetical protein [Gammaproteobacteria bacterium]
MTFGKDPVANLTAFVLIAFIISVITFSSNTKTPLNIDEQPQYSFLDSR